MALAEHAELIVRLSLQDRLTAGVKGVQKSMSGIEGSARRIQKALSGGAIGQGLRFGTGFFAAERILRAIPATINSAVQSLDELQSVEAQTAAAIKSTGQAANLTAKQIRDLSVALEDKTTIDDKTIQRGANLLLTFTNIQNRVGKGNDIFNQATTAILDMSTALGTDVKQSAIQLGKALQDPIAGVGALRRVGVAFTKDQQKLIADLIKEGKILDAQKLILAEINKEFGGSAAAQANTYAGQVRRLGDAFEDLKLAAIKAALPGLTRLVTGLADTFRNPAFVKGAEDFGKSIADLLTKDNFDGIKDFVTGTLPPLIDGLKLAAEATKQVVGVFRSLPPELQKAIVLGVVANKLSGGLVGSAVGAVVKGGIGGVIGGLRGSTPASPVFTKEVGVGGAGGTGGLGGKLGTGLALGAAAIGVFGTIETAQQESARNTAISTDLQAKTNEWLSRNPSKADLQNGLAGVEQGIQDIRSNPLNVLVQGEALNKLEAMRAEILAQIAATNSLKPFLVSIAQAALNGRQTINYINSERQQSGTGSIGGARNSNATRGTMPVPKTPRSGNENNRGGGGFSPGGLPTVIVKTSVSTDHRQNSQASSTQLRYGPTPAVAGAS